MREKTTIPFLISGLIVLIGIIILIVLYHNWLEADVSIQQPVIDKVTDEGTSPTLKNIIHEAEKNVVQIEGINELETITGSGFLYNDKGDIVTNAHVIANADLIYVRTANAHVYPAAVVGIGEDVDVAVIRVPDLSGEYSLPIQTKNFAEIGDEVIALGSPHGFQNTVTLGIISGEGRNFSVDGYNYENVYQISAPITHGNSGGPLIHRETGEIIGINSVGTNDGSIGFSIPIYDVDEQIKEWSKEVHNADLDFPSTSDMIVLQNPEISMDDAEYLVDYFLESIEIRDYVSAYALLGSNLQLEEPYADFRDDYIHILHVTYEQMKGTEKDGNQVQIDVNVKIEKRDQSNKKTINETRQIQFLIGYENDQLKIIDIQFVE